MQNVFGSVDGSHIKIDRPTENQSSYYNRKDFFSIQIQIVCDHNLRILDFHAGYPGKVHDARVFRNSRLFDKLTDPNLSMYINIYT